MILIDANLLLYAENKAAPEHSAAKEWWDRQLSETQSIALCWPVLSAFLRIATSTRAFARPLTIDQASDCVESWINRPNVRLIGPTASHWTIFRELLDKGQAGGNLVSDAHLAALAIEHGCELQSTDADFSRFPKLKWRNPLRKV